MHRNLLGALACPICRTKLTIQDAKGIEAVPPESGMLRCENGHCFPILECVPRLTPEMEVGEGLAAPRAETPTREDGRSRKSFSLQWEMHGEEERTWFKDDLTQRREEFPKSFGVAPADLAGKLILDAGCGNGRLSAAVATLGAEVVAFDFSESCVAAHRRKAKIAGERAGWVHFLQADVLRQPFFDGTFDYVHSSGVIHHTPDPEGALRELVRVGKPGGKVYVQLYRVRPFPIGQVLATARFFTTKLPTRVLKALCWAGVPGLKAVSWLMHKLRGEGSMPSSSYRTWAVQLFDNLSPKYQFRYRSEDVEEMMRRAGLHDPQETTLEDERRHMVAFVATKPHVDSEIIAVREEAQDVEVRVAASSGWS